MSRLERLFILLSSTGNGNGGGSAILAANQLGEVQKTNNNLKQLEQLLSRLHPLLRSVNWETRMAAAKALTAIIKQVPQFGSTHEVDDNLSAVDEKDSGCYKDKIKFNFDIEDILASGKQNVIYTPEEEEPSMVEDLKEQKERLTKTLGLQFSCDHERGVDPIITDDDLIPMTNSNDVSLDPEQNNLSSRQRNVIRRQSRARKRLLDAEKGKGQGKCEGTGVYSTENLLSDNISSNPAKRIKVEDSGLYKPKLGAIDSTKDIDNESCWSGRWPFADFAECLFKDLNHSKWEVRHGSATAIREIILHHGRSAGWDTSLPFRNQNDLCNISWLIEVAKLLLCVLANDRFGDFVSDQVVAPVRETSAMALGSCLRLLHPEACNDIIGILLLLLDFSDWQARHGAILAIKYLLLARPPSGSSLNQQFLKRVFPGLVKSLTDPVDDVVGSAAVALIPVVDVLVQLQASGSMDKPYDVDSVTEKLWSSLEDLDELENSTNAVLKLLSTILKYTADRTTYEVQQNSDQGYIGMHILVLRILPFLYHSSTSVRHSALDALTTMTYYDKLASQFLHVLSGPILKLLFRQALLEHNDKILLSLESVWNAVCDKTPLQSLLQATCPLYGSWLHIITQSSSHPLPQHLFVYKEDIEIPHNKPQYIGGSGAQCESNLLEKDRLISRARCLGARLLGKLACFIAKPVPGVDYSRDSMSPIEMLVEKILLPMLTNGKSAYKQFIVSLVISEWCKFSRSSYSDITVRFPDSLKLVLNRFLTERINYDETLNSQRNLQNEALELLSMMKSVTDVREFMIEDHENRNETNLTQDQIRGLTVFNISTVQEGRIKKEISEKQHRILSDLNDFQRNYVLLHTMSSASIAGAVIDVHVMVDKLNPVIKPIMEAVKTQENHQIQNYSVDKVSKLLEMCLKRGLTNVAEKVLKNLSYFACATEEKTLRCTKAQVNVPPPNDQCGILSINEYEFHASMYSLKRIKGKKAILQEHSEEQLEKNVTVQVRGATQALKSIVEYFGEKLPKCFPQFWEFTIECYQKGELLNHNELITSLQTFEIVVPELAGCFPSTLKQCLPNLCELSKHDSKKVRHFVAKCLAKLALPSVGISSSVMLAIDDHLLPNFDNVEKLHHRQGAIEAIYVITTRLGLDIVPYIVLFIVSILGRMSDQDEDVRLLAARTFATLVKLIPLDNLKRENNIMLDPVLMKRKLTNQKFLDELLDPVKNVQNFEIPVKIEAEFRGYQLDGIKWLAFLNKYKLHGILCDDMGLGKTIQAITIMVSDHYYRRMANSSVGSSDNSPLPSLVICPSTLCGHWNEEIKKFVPNREHLDCIVYGQRAHFVGQRTGGNRDALKSRIRNLILNQKSDNLVVVASYDIVRIDSDFFSSLHWNYVVLDEGHMIKNSKTKTTKVIKSLKANYRLILSGTPIQNSVLDLWSLFDFLMPGFLGTEQQFNSHYSKPIIASRNSKESRLQERGALAIEALHRQVLPFIMRRMKGDVLKDLPPKIIQDHHCDLSPLQYQLYEDCIKKERQKEEVCSKDHLEHINDKFEGKINAVDTTISLNKQHVFQTLQYLRKVCNHPKLILEAKPYQSLSAHHSFKDINLNDINHSGKLPALRDLLLQCGIGTSGTDENGDDFGASAESTITNDTIVGQHRALIFFQLKSMIDIVETDLFKAQMPSITYLRLDGSIPSSSRHLIVQKFNEDVTIDVLLLTTSVGGLGLNLTGADTVIFFEHDWNPMKDLQAMDRAHRIGQKKVVNVYRLISTHTIEEKILGLQQFKLKTANTVISSDNANMNSMMSASDEIFDLFSLHDESGDKNDDDSKKSTKKGIKALLDNLPELWDNKEYEDEYNVNTF